ncbi:peptidase [Acidovorax sp. GBBC 3332]|nr:MULTISPECIES: peptidase [unclassified Acidovorax]MDA8449831.1 peptidase [Acidovorax sp. GBBC 3297]MDA8459276.1 peptidase [Acidovorax sp. GBBC 3333]MDA8464313.1 peptidase [Acidovorax sp. GBBC 3332]MDA8469477.1 peptidase [Acidovorax sp. GBBC 3299]
MKPLHIFRAGTHTDQSGRTVTLTAADLAASAAAYDPAKHEAPIVIGHPATDGPAYAWVASASTSGEDLEAVPQQVDPAFAELVDKGRYKKISTSFYAPDSAANPVPGVWYIKHVGFLGAKPPAVKGLRAVAFAQGEEGVVEFADWAGSTNASMWRRFREWLIGTAGLEVADQVAPAYEIEYLRDAAQRADDAASPAFAEPSQEIPVTKEEAERLRAENARLQAEAQQRAQAERHAQSVAFAEGEVAANRLKPKHVPAVVAFLDFAEAPAADGGAVCFGEGDERKPLAQAFREFVADGAPVVSFGEHATGARAKPAGTVNPLLADADARSASGR